MTKEETKEYNRNYYIKNKEKIKKIQADYYINNKEYITKCNKKYRDTNNSILSEKHIENQFEPWMNWSNYGKYNGDYEYGWDIDHIIELQTSNSEEELLKLNHYSNLRPLDSKINRVDRRYR